MSARTIPTVEDILRLSEEGKRYELVDGELVEMSPTGFEHGVIENSAAWVLTNHVRPRRLGQVVTGEVLFHLDRAAGLARAADVAFIRRGRMRRERLTGAFDGPPDLAVEIVSLGNTAEEIQRKVRDWLDHGTLAVLVMYPGDRRVALWREKRGLDLGRGELLDLDPVVPGFRCPVDDLFPPPLEEDEDSEKGSDEGRT